MYRAVIFRSYTRLLRVRGEVAHDGARGPIEVFRLARSGWFVRHVDAGVVRVFDADLDAAAWLYEAAVLEVHSPFVCALFWVHCLLRRRGHHVWVGRGGDHRGLMTADPREQAGDEDQKVLALDFGFLKEFIERDFVAMKLDGVQNGGGIWLAREQFKELEDRPATTWQLRNTVGDVRLAPMMLREQLTEVFGESDYRSIGKTIFPSRFSFASCSSHRLRSANDGVIKSPTPD
jgi:hypothetical protein